MAGHGAHRRHRPGDAGDVTVPAGALVTVIRKMKDGLYVQVRGSGSGPLEPAVSVRESHTIPANGAR
jgi:hypothetical protein